MATRTRSRGQQQRRAAHEARIRRPNLVHHYRFRIPEIEPGLFEFELTLMREKGKGDIRLTRITESFSWADEEAVLAGSVTLRRPDPDSPTTLPIAKGHRIRCRVRWGSRKSWYELWTMRCGAPETNLSSDGTTVTVELQDDLVKLRQNKRKYTLRKTKKRKVGYYAHEVARIVAKRAGVKLGRVAKGTVRVPKIAGEMSDLDAIKKAYAYEREKTGRRFVIRFDSRGRLEVLPYQRNRILYSFAHQILSALTNEESKDNPTTVIEGKGRIGKGKAARKVRHTEMNRAIVNRFGYVHEEKNYGRVDSIAELREKVRRDYAKQIRIKRTATLEVPGIPFIRRGEGIQWLTDEPGWHGRSEKSLDRSFVFTTGVRHNVDSGGQYTTSMDIVQDDPFVKDQERREKEARDRKRRARKSRKRGDQA